MLPASFAGGTCRVQRRFDPLPRLAEPEVGEFDITGEPMQGWVMVAPDGRDTYEQLRRWIELATEFVRTLPKK